jgi:hypothetical protein
MTPDELTAEWFAAVLAAPVVAVHAVPVGTGQVGTSIRCVLTYGDDRLQGAGGTRPASVVVKVPSVDETSRATGTAMLTYVREAGFYRELQSTVDVRSPRCHHLDWDPVTHDFALVLEDLAPCEQGDQIAGCDLDRAAVAVGELTALHAPRWGDAGLDDVTYLGRYSHEHATRLGQIYSALWPGFVERYGTALSAEQLALGGWLGTRLDRWLLIRSGPSTLTHGDYRLDNMLFPTTPGAHPIAVVDWQTVGQGPAGADLAYFVGGGLAIDDRRRHERDLVALYHGALRGRGVDGWDLDACWRSYRENAFSGVVMTVVSSMIVGRTDRGDAMFRAMATRHLQHALDLDAGALLM